MAGLKERVGSRVERLRSRHPLVDRAFRTLSHYGSVNGSALSGAVTYFGFLSFFPILALAFFVVGVLATFYPDLRSQMAATISRLLPGVIGPGPGQIQITTFETYAGTVGLLGLLGLLYSGLGWLSGMRGALEAMFVLPKREQPNFLVGKLRDLATLGLIGLVLLVSVILSAAVSGASGQILAWVGIDPHSTVPHVLLWLLGHALAIAASAVLLLAMFRYLAQPQLPRRALAEGALLGAVGFELLKSVATLLISHTRGQPAFQAFGVALILVLWINYFTRIVMYGAAWAYTHPLAVEARAAEHTRAPAAALGEADGVEDRPERAGGNDGQDEQDEPGGPGAAGRARGVGLAVAALGGTVLTVRALRRRR
ncbi:MAG: YihY/virulence factor BrkB family protein [Nocardioidaceae bacterium]